VLATLAEFADDSAAQIGGIARYGFYHTAGVVKTRIQADLNSSYMFTPTSYMFLASAATFARLSAWTLEFWTNLTEPLTTDVQVFFDTRTPVTPLQNASEGMSVCLRPNNTVGVYAQGDSDWYIGSTSLQLNSWTHVAVVRNAMQMKMFIGGVLCGTFNLTSMWNSIVGSGVLLGNSGHWGAPEQLRGGLSQVRISSSALYTANFTPSRTLSPSGSLFHLGANSKNSVDGRSMTVYGPVTQGFLPAA
jgi:hypothetical protein